MRHIVLAVLIFTIVLVIATEGFRRRKYGRFSGVRQNDRESRDDYRPYRRRGRHMSRPWRRRFNFGLFNNNRRKWFNFDIDFDFNHGKPWYEGVTSSVNDNTFLIRPNVCTHKDVIKNETTSDEKEITGHAMIKSVVCDDKGSSYKCTYSVKVDGREEIIVESRECCKGYTRKENQYGCPTVLVTKDLLASAKDLKLSKFLEALTIAGIEDDLKRGNVTVFAPVDGAFEEMSELLLPDSEIRLQDAEVLMVSQPLINNMVSDLKALLLGHVSPGVYTSGRLNDEQLVDTVSPYKNKIRINYYSNNLMTANCVKVKSRDTVTTNGVIHVMEDMLEPVSETLLDFVSTDPEMSYLKTAIGKSGLGKTLREEGQFTLFAPSDSAFRKLDPVLLSRILDGDKECLIKLLKNHLLTNVICSAAIQGNAKSSNLLNKYVNLTRDSDDKIFVNGAQAVDMDTMATNGVLYVIDEVLVPDEALDVLAIANKSGASTVANLIAQTGLGKTLQTNENLTLFAPSDEAMGNLENFTTDPTEILKILTYHVVPSRVKSCNVYNDQQLDTLNTEKIRINEYSTSFPFGLDPWSWVQTAQCANIKKANIEACNGYVFVIDKVLTPPRGKLLDVLASDSRFSELVQLLKIAEIGDALEEDGPFTIFAPTNDAFKQLDDKELESIVNDKDKLKKLLLNHVHKDQLCCSGLRVVARDIGFRARRLKMLSKTSFKVDIGYDKLNVGEATIEECDVTATNGVIHVLDKVLLEKVKYDGFWSDEWWSRF